MPRIWLRLRCHRWIEVCVAPCARLSRRSATNMRRQLAAATRPVVSASRISAAHRYHRMNAPVMSSTASRRVSALLSGCSAATASALRCTGPRVSLGRSGPITRSGTMSSWVLPIWTSWAGPDQDKVGMRAPTPMSCPATVTCWSGVIRIVAGRPSTRHTNTRTRLGPDTSSRNTPRGGRVEPASWECSAAWVAAVRASETTAPPTSGQRVAKVVQEGRTYHEYLGQPDVCECYTRGSARTASKMSAGSRPRSRRRHDADEL